MPGSTGTINQKCFHQSLDDLAPNQVYNQKHAIPQAA
ncbi:hypothetical protein SAMN05216419_10724 [Nitrosomonas cryotolerans]|nr:hypothetical protein SAMN05216419_10724 [Nitrosomonas cryotolerans]